MIYVCASLLFIALFVIAYFTARDDEKRFEKVVTDQMLYSSMRRSRMQFQEALNKAPAVVMDHTCEPPRPYQRWLMFVDPYGEKFVKFVKRDLTANEVNELYTSYYALGWTLHILYEYSDV